MQDGKSGSEPTANRTARASTNRVPERVHGHGDLGQREPDTAHSRDQTCGLHLCCGIPAVSRHRVNTAGTRTPSRS